MTNKEYIENVTKTDKEACEIIRRAEERESPTEDWFKILKQRIENVNFRIPVLIEGLNYSEIHEKIDKEARSKFLYEVLRPAIYGILYAHNQALLEEIKQKLSKKARHLDYADRNEFDEAFEIVEEIIKKFSTAKNT